MSDQPDSFPEGWQLGAESWRFHRRFFARVGRPCAHGEYTSIRAQIRYHLAEPLGFRYYRIKLADGTPLVINGGWHRLAGVEHADWMPKAKPVVVVQPVVAPPPTEPPPPPPVVEPPPRRPLRASTLTLGSPAAAKALTERLRRFGIPPPVSNHASPP